VDPYTLPDSKALLQLWKSKYNLTDCFVNYIKPEVDEIFDAYADDDPKMLAETLRRYEKEQNLGGLEYMLDEPVGRGAFGQVFRGHHIAKGDTVAIKIIDLEESKDDVQTISAEIRALSSARHCDQLIRYYTSFVVQTKLWIVTEFIDGGSVLDRLKIKTLKENQVAVVCREVLLGLKFMGEEGKIHRDIKAANILLSLNGQVKLADFGASAQLTDTMTKCSTFIGSPYWMAPEIMLQNRYDSKADVWSLGITCLEMLNGSVPLQEIPPVRAIRVIPKNPEPRIPPEIYSKDLTDFVNACLTKDPNKRPTVNELLRHPFILNAGPISLLDFRNERSHSSRQAANTAAAASSAAAAAAAPAPTPSPAQPQQHPEGSTTSGGDGSASR